MSDTRTPAQMSYAYILENQGRPVEPAAIAAMARAEEVSAMFGELSLQLNNLRKRHDAMSIVPARYSVDRMNLAKLLYSLSATNLPHRPRRQWADASPLIREEYAMNADMVIAFIDN